jgi:E3 ubiquitin-protein ligase UBR1
MLLSPLEKQLATLLGEHPRTYNNRYTEAASNRLIQILFTSLTADRADYLQLLFPKGPPPPSEDKRWSLREAQGAVEGAEYTEAARGHPCGHIFKNGEATYRCRTCSSDDTCVLCTRCFEASDHEGHNVFVTLSPGNSGCCDCGDPEAWIRDVNCTIHTVKPGQEPKSTGKAKTGSPLPPELVTSIQVTIARSLDYLCDVFSCSPEQLRLPKTEETVRDDERQSRLPSKIYNTRELEEQDSEFCLILWNDEKHTVNDVRDQVARACRISEDDGLNLAHEVNDVGRSILMISNDLPKLLNAAKIIEQPKLTVTVRSARDTFREQMCSTIVEWISDISGCSIGPDSEILRNTICEELLKGWRVGSEAHLRAVGKGGLDDNEAIEEDPGEFHQFGRYPAHARTGRRPRIQDIIDSDSSDDEDENAGPEEDEMDIDGDSTADQDYADMDVDDIGDALEASEATMAGYPPPPPPPPHPRRRVPGTVSADSDEGDSAQTPHPMDSREPTVPRTPKDASRSLRGPRPPKYWMEKPESYRKHGDVHLAEDLWRRVRLDYFILYDLRMWKRLRTDLRDVFISTVVTLPHFKRLLGLRFAGVYTVLAELYLIADREPDHSIINLSLQMLTTPTITAEVVERGNFLTNLMAILYTFLTTRQVGYPAEVNLASTLAFEQGAVTNRRTFHFYMDMRYLLLSELVQEKVRSEDRYLLQFLDLAKLHQGICPNIRAIGEHVEFETDAWLSASLIVQEIIKLCRLVGDCFALRSDDDISALYRAIRSTARVAIINSLGSESRRFDQSEIRGETRFKYLQAFEFDEDVGLGPEPYQVVDYVVEEEPMSFHHALHYTLSWLIDKGKSMNKEQILRLLRFSWQELRQPPVPPKAQIPEYEPELNLLALFDFPLRVLAWLAQMRAGMWVRNGITLRHQMGAYRGFPRRELSYQRDIFMLQTAFVLLPPATVLASVVDRFDITDLIRGNYSLKAGKEEQQQIEVAEDFVHLLIILLSDRAHLLPLESDPDPQLTTARRDVVHNLCFKPLSYSSLSSHIADKFSDTDAFDELIQEMTLFKPPEGVSDHGTFMLKEKFYEEIDPYLSYFSRNQRDEAENIYRTHMAKRVGKEPADIVYEPNLQAISGGLFKDLSNFTRLPLFAQVIFYLLQYCMVADRYAPTVPSTKVDQFLQFILHLTLIAVKEDNTEDDSMSGDGLRSFCTLALTKRAKIPLANCDTIALLLRRISEMETFKACEPKVRVILRYLRHKRPNEYLQWAHTYDLPVERSTTASPMPSEDKEAKKKAALDRQARVMAQFKQQQNSFLANQTTIDWGEEEFSDLEDEFQTPTEEEEKVWKYPSGTCILCQEETNEEKLYGTFALMTPSKILRQTNIEDADWIAEALETPTSLDRSAEAVRPFGVAGHNRRKIHKVTAEGKVVELERQELAKGFPSWAQKTGPVTTGCGHIMHFSCFEIYLAATLRRHQTQIARNHPERILAKEFLCPLCKALGNTFLPVIWKGKTIRYPGELEPEVPFEEFLNNQIGVRTSKLGKDAEKTSSGESNSSHNASTASRSSKLFMDYGHQEMVTPLASRLQDLTKANTTYQAISNLTPRQTMMGNIPVVINIGGIDDSFIPSSVLASMTGETSATPIAPQLMELIKVYQRLRDTMAKNELFSSFGYPGGMPDDLVHTDTLARSLGSSISAAEIAQRGVESDPSATLLDKISSQTVTHLRVLSETIASYIAIGGLRNGGANQCANEFSKSQAWQLVQIFAGHPDILSLEDMASEEAQKRLFNCRPPLLTQDSFIFLTECAAGLIPATTLDVHHIMRLCYIAEIIRVIVVSLLLYPELSGNVPTYVLGDVAAQDPDQLQGFSDLVSYIMKEVNHPGTLNSPFIQRVYRLVAAYSLPFLRKCTILMHVRYGIDFPPTDATHDEPESSRLSGILRLPVLPDLISQITSSPTTMAMITGWMRHWKICQDSPRAEKSVKSISLSHPAVFELIGLPKNFDSLQDEAMKRRCPTTGKDQTDPVVCLFCGEIFCSQAVCCKNKDNKGGCWQHREK